MTDRARVTGPLMAKQKLSAHRDDYIDSWYTSSAPATELLPELKGSHKTDVCVIGGGYTGLSCALHLAEKGVNTILVESRRIGWGASGRNGGHVGTGQRVDQKTLEKWLGLERAKRLWDLSLTAVDLVVDLIETHHIDCELGSDNLHFAAKKKHAIEMAEEVEHLQICYGYNKIKYLKSESVGAVTSARGFLGACHDQGAKHLHPFKYVLGLARAAIDAGSQIFEHTRAIKVTEGTDGVNICCESGEVHAKKVVVACNGYLDSLKPSMARRIMPINNFMVATEPLSNKMVGQINPLRTSMSDSLFIINYWKLSADNRLLFGGGENYTRHFPTDIKAFVRPYLLKIYPELELTQLDYGWGGTLGITRSRMPDVGCEGFHTYYAQGFSGHGVPTATFAGQILAKAILGDCRDFDLFAGIPKKDFPGGTLLRWPGLVAGMMFYATLDKFGR